MKKTHIGSKLDDFLQADRLLEATTVTATKRVIAHQIATEMKRRRLTKMAMASRMKTSRAALDRLLDPNNPSVTIGTLERAAAALHRRLKVELRCPFIGPPFPEAIRPRLSLCCRMTPTATLDRRRWVRLDASRCSTLRRKLPE